MSSRNKGIAFSDSFDSAKANSSGNSHGQVACLNGSVNIGTGSIMGDLLLGPPATAPFTPPSGRIFHNLNADFPEVVTPTPNWLPAAFSYQNIGGTDYTYVFSRANQGEYTINTGGSIYVGADANVCLQIQSANFNASSLYVAGTNQHAGKLLIYALQPNVSLGDVTVESGKAANFVYLGTSKNTSLTIDTDLKFFGTIYAPSAALTYNVPSQGKKLKVGSFSGSCIAKSVQVNGAASFHFDEDLLRHSSMARGYVITSWKEL